MQRNIYKLGTIVVLPQNLTVYVVCWVSDCKDTSKNDVGKVKYVFRCPDRSKGETFETLDRRTLTEKTPALVVGLADVYSEKISTLRKRNVYLMDKFLCVIP